MSAISFSVSSVVQRRRNLNGQLKSGSCFALGKLNMNPHKLINPIECFDGGDPMLGSLINHENSWVDESLILRKKGSKPRNSGVFWVTEIAGPCLRAIYFGRKIGKPPSLDLLRIFNSGRVLESWWIDLLDQRKDVFVLGENVPCRHINSFYRVHGWADVLLQREYGEIEVHE